MKQSDTMHALTTSDDLEAALRAPAAVLLKHSTRCPISAAALEEVTQLRARNPDVPVYLVDVHEQRDLSDEVAERLGVAHNSPQAFVLARGVPVWQASHYSIKARKLAEELAAVG